jgi:hypothetical protein
VVSSELAVTPTPAAGRTGAERKHQASSDATTRVPSSFSCARFHCCDEQKDAIRYRRFQICLVVGEEVRAEAQKIVDDFSTPHAFFS